MLDMRFEIKLWKIQVRCLSGLTDDRFVAQSISNPISHISHLISHISK
jgi:hypothetical protein